jgi:hypothetical protein
VYEKDNLKMDPITCGCHDEFGDIFETESDDNRTFKTDVEGTQQLNPVLRRIRLLKLTRHRS